MSQETTPEQEHLKRLSSSLGRLAPKGTWLCEVLENIWRSETQEEANAHADKAVQVLSAIGIQDALWCGDRIEIEKPGEWKAALLRIHPTGRGTPDEMATDILEGLEAAKRAILEKAVDAISR